MHHPFTSPKHRVDRHLRGADPGEALAYAYDLVCNGNEIGGGSIRIHRGDVQERVFALLGLSAEEPQEKFGFLLDAFPFGPPPHGGIAFGRDRICMLLAGADVDPRRHRLPEDRRRLGPADRRPDADHRAAAQGGRHRRRPSRHDRGRSDRLIRWSDGWSLDDEPPDLIAQDHAVAWMGRASPAGGELGHRTR